MKFQDWKIQIRVQVVLTKWAVDNSLTIEQASEKMGISIWKFKLLLKQQAYPTLSELIIIADITGLSTDYILARD